MENIYTPKQITSDVRQFCQSIDSTQLPVFVPIQISSNTKKQFCFANVKRKTRKGGKVLHGWAIFERAKISLEAQFHAVWQKPDETLVDVSPPMIEGETQTLFLPDSVLVFDIASDPVVENKLWQIANDSGQFEEYSRWYRLYASILGRYPNGMDIPPVEIMESLLRMKDALWKLYTFHGVETESPGLDLEKRILPIRYARFREYRSDRICICGSDKPYGQCCRIEDGKLPA